MAQHLGLEQLATLAEAAGAFLGPVKSAKFVVDEERGDSVLVGSAPRLLERLELGATGRLLAEAVRAQHAAHGVATGTLLCLAGAWSRAAQECLQLGVPVSALVALMNEGLGACLDAVDALRLPVRLSCRHMRGPRPLPAAHAPVAWVPGLPWSDRGLDSGSREPPVPCAPRTDVGAREGTALAHSRHFRGSQGPHPGSAAPSTQGCHDLGQLVGALSRGDPGSMWLAGTALWLLDQSESLQPGSCPGPPTLDLTRVLTCHLPGPPEAASYVCPGYATVLPAAQAPLVSALQGRPLRAVLLEGDLTESYRHPGLHPPASRMCTVLGGGPGPEEEEEEAAWAERVLGVLGGLQVHLVLVQGRVCPGLREVCAAAGQLVLDSVPRDALWALAEATGAQPVAYVWQLSELCVGAGVCLAVLGEGVRGLIVSVGVNGVRLVTAVLTCPAEALMQAREDRFWASARRLQQALGERSVFPGGGAVELLCLSRLQALAEMPPDPPARRPGLQLHAPAVLGGLARGWHSFLAAALSRRSPFPSELEAATRVQRLLQAAVSSGAPDAYILRECRTPHVYDLVTPKLEAWRRALDLVLLVLQTDAEVVVGTAHVRATQGAQAQVLL